MKDEIIKHTMKQQTPDWREIKCGKASASNFNNILKLDGTLRTSDGYWTYIYKVIFEQIEGYIRDDFECAATAHGNATEPKARDWFVRQMQGKLRMSINFELPGFLESACGRFGCSPDGIFDWHGEPCGLEIKCPLKYHVHAKYNRDAKLPNEHAMQVHGGMAISGFKQWAFLSYYEMKINEVPTVIEPFIYCVKRDKTTENITKSLESFWGDLVEAKKRMGIEA